MKYEYWMNQIPGIFLKTRNKIRHYVKSAKELYELSDCMIDAMTLLTEAEKNRIKQSKKQWDLEKEYEKLGKMGISFVTREDGRYPKKLIKIPDAPDALYVKGTLPDENDYTAAIVGARCCSEYGKAEALDISGTLSECGVSIISGMARGIDACGHRGALQKNGTTYAVLGCGVDVCYPSEHQNLYDEISIKGGIISEYPPKRPPIAAQFPQRNRIISGMSDVVLVIEARERSGSLITAEFALEQGRDVYALPGRISDSLSRGCNRLIKDGAGVILSAKDLQKDLGFASKNRSTNKKNKRKALEKQQMVVYSCLDLHAKSMDEIILESGLELLEVSSILSELVQKGYVREIFKNYYIRS